MSFALLAVLLVLVALVVLFVIFLVVRRWLGENSARVGTESCGGQCNAAPSRKSAAWGK